MKLLRILRKACAGAGLILALAALAYLVFFATMTYETVTATGVASQATEVTRTTEQVPLRSQFEPLSWAVLIGMTLLIAAGALAAWRGALAAAALISLLALATTYVTGFSIGVFYMPAAGLLVLATLLVAVEKVTEAAKAPQT